MKILFITDLYPISKSEKHTPVTLHNFVIEWMKQGHTVEVIKPNFIFNSFLRGKNFYKTGFYDFYGVKIFNVNYFLPFCGNILQKVSKSFDFSSYDVIVAHMPSGIIFANKIANIFDKPLICGVHSSDIEVLTNPLYSFYFCPQMKVAYKNAKKIACRSFVLQKKFNELMHECAEKTFVAASGVNSSINSAKLLTTHHSPLTVLTCANLIKRKNIAKLILAVKDSPDFCLKIIGDGKELKHLKRLSSVGLLSNQPKVDFLGHLPHEKVLEEMKNADIFALPSVNETFGMVYLEAMASGCITVCTKNDGIDGIIKDGENGFLTEPTVDRIKETLLRIKNCEKKEEIIKNCFETVKKNTPENCARNYIENIS